MTVKAVDLRSETPLARDQGARPTCLAFAVSDAHKHAGGHPGLLSPEYLHFHATRRAQVTLNTGVGVSTIREALRVDGQPLEAECPYSDIRADGWKPASKFSSIWKRDSSVSGGKASEVLMSALSKKRAHVLVFRISRSFHAPDGNTHIVREDGGKDRRLHAILIVGMAPISGSMAFLARNSWGTRWGEDGHAWLPLSYVDARAVSVIEVAEVSA